MTRARLADAARRRAALPRRSGVGRAVRAAARAGRDDRRCRRRCARGSTADAPAGARAGRRAVSDDGDTVKLLWGLDGGAHDRDRAHALPRPRHGVRVEPGRLRDGVRLLRHRPGRLRAPPHHRRDRRAGRARDERALARPADASRTSCSWGWASRSPTTTARGTAVERMHDDIGLSARHLTISTVGIVPGIRRLAAERLPVNLAVSLHAANDDAARRARADQQALPARRARRRVPRLIAARRPAALVRVGADRRRQRPPARRGRARRATPDPLRAHVNLIPLNPTPGWPTRGTPLEPASSRSATASSSAA